MDLFAIFVVDFEIDFRNSFESVHVDIQTITSLLNYSTVAERKVLAGLYSDMNQLNPAEKSAILHHWFFF